MSSSILKGVSLAFALWIIFRVSAGTALAETTTGDSSQGKKLFETCRGCHGVKGYHNVYPTYKVPKLGGQSAHYVASALKSYRDGQRVHPTMKANAFNLSDQDALDIGAYLESLGSE